MDVWVIVTGVAVVVGMIAGIVQVIDYLEKRRRRAPAPEKKVDPPPHKTAIPNNLPPRGGFVGREKEKARLREALASPWPVICIDGIGGIGKTALALEIAAECLHGGREGGPPAFDGVIWTSARDRALTLNNVLDTIARTLDYPGIAQQPPAEKAAAVRALLQGGRYLILVDNLEAVTDEALGAFLLELPEPSKALVTSREQKLPRAFAVSLKEMDPGEALALVRSEGRRLGLAAVEAGDEAPLLRLVEATGGAPLAIKWALGQIKQRGQSLDAVLEALHAARGDVFAPIFARSWSLLQPEARHVLMAMPLFATSAARAAVEAASGVPRSTFGAALGQLVEMRLVDANDALDEARRRYSIHPLTRAFARQALDGVPAFAAEAQARLAAWYLSSVQEVGRQRAAFETLERELPNVGRYVEWCYQGGDWVSVRDYFRALWTFLKERGHWDEALRLGGWALDAARRLSDLSEEGHCCLEPFVWVHRHRGELAQARAWAERARAIFGQLEQETDKLWVDLALGDIAWQAGDLEQTRQIFDQVLGHLRQGQGEPLQLVTALLHLSRLAWSQHEYEEAERLAREGLCLAQETADEFSLAAAQHRLGLALVGQGRLDEASAVLEQCLAIDEKHQIRHGIAWSKLALARLEEKRGNRANARALAEEAGELYRRLGMKREMEDAGALLARLAGDALPQKP